MNQSRSESKQGFLELHDRLGKRLLAFLVRRVHDDEVAADIWAESWALAYENWHRLRSPHDKTASEAWVFGIARNQLAAYYRSGFIERRALKRLQWTVPPIDGALDEELERIVNREVLKLDVADALLLLPAKRRRAVRLRILEGREYREVAASLGCSEQAARAQVSRGLRRLAKALDLKESRTSELMTR